MPFAFSISQSADDVSTNTARLFGVTCELLQATLHVVSFRTTRMALAGPAPDDRDQREFSQMSFEKGEAATETVLAMASGTFDLMRTLASNANEHFLATSAAGLMLASSQSPAEWFEHQAALWRLSAEYPANPLQLASLSTTLMHRVLAPIHGRATANAKRLIAP